MKSPSRAADDARPQTRSRPFEHAAYPIVPIAREIMEGGERRGTAVVSMIPAIYGAGTPTNRPLDERAHARGSPS